MKSNRSRVSEELQSETLKALRFPLAVMVVFIHSFCLKEYRLPDWEHLSGMDINVAIQILLSHVVSHIAVPAFYLISGYFFFYKVATFDFATYKSKLRKRVHTLLVPYLLWNAIGVVWIVILKIGAFFIKGKPLSHVTSYIQENHIRLFWDSSVWSLHYKNMLGFFTPHWSCTNTLMVSERFDSCCRTDASYLLPYQAF